MKDMRTITPERLEVLKQSPATAENWEIARMALEILLRRSVESGDIGLPYRQDTSLKNYGNQRVL